MTALGPNDMSARRRPFVVLTLAGLRAAAGLCLAWQLASLIASSGIGLRAEGDRARGWGSKAGGDYGVTFLVLNRNKREPGEQSFDDDTGHRRHTQDAS